MTEEENAKGAIEFKQEIRDLVPPVAKASVLDLCEIYEKTEKKVIY